MITPIFLKQESNPDYWPVFLPQSWLVEPERGLTLKNATLDDVGEYECVGTMNDLSTRKYFKIVVSGIQTKVFSDCINDGISNVNLYTNKDWN